MNEVRLCVCEYSTPYGPLVPRLSNHQSEVINFLWIHGPFRWNIQFVQKKLFWQNTGYWKMFLKANFESENTSIDNQNPVNKKAVAFGHG